METKKCTRCNIEKPFSQFSKDVNKLDKLRTQCKQCGKQKYLLNHDAEIERVKKYQKNNREKVLKSKLVSTKKYVIKNREKVREYQKIYKRNRRENDILFKLSHNIRSRLLQYIKKNNIIKRNTTFKIVGCSPEELKIHLEKKFTENMSWNNQGKWHIDHIIPLSIAKTEEELYKLCHFTNLQPMWGLENIRKGKKIV